MAGALAVSVQPEGAFAQVVLGDQLVCAGFVAAQVQKLVAVAHDGFPLFFIQRLELGDVLDDDRHRNVPAPHGGQQLVEVVRQADVGKLVHEEMPRHGQAAAMHPVGAVKQLLEGAGVEQAD